MRTDETLNMTTPTDLEIFWTRIFDARRDLVFDAMTKPELIRRWLLGPEGWTMPVCEVELSVGGAYRYVGHHEKKGEMGMGGVFREIIKPERIVNTEKFEQSWYPGEALATIVLTEQGGKTILKTAMLYESKEARDGVIKSNMEAGLQAGYNRLENILAEIG